MDSSSALDCDLFELASRVLDAFPDEIPFDDFGWYRLLRTVGKGGMGEVFLAHNDATQRDVAIKFLRFTAPDRDLRRRFTRETEMLAKLEHPYIARLYDIGVHPNGAPFAVMEFVDGTRLDDFCREHGSSLEQRMSLFRSVCDAVQYAHDRAVVHLDLKPSNILVTPDQTPKLLDFGIARHLENVDQPVDQTQLRCTPAYAAPEQIRREPVGTYTDVYALGIILYELLAGKHPYSIDGSLPTDIAAIASNQQGPERPSRSATRIEARKTAWNDLDVLCLKALKRDIDDRYHSVVELRQDIDHFLGNEPLNARPDKFTYRAGKFLRRHRQAVFASAAVLVVIAGLIGFYTARLAQARDSALQQAARTQRIQRFVLGLFGGDYNAAPAGDLRVVDMLERGVGSARILNNEPAVQADLYETLGGIYHSLGSMERADSLLQAGLDRRRSIFGADHPDVADALVALAILRLDQARFAEAEQLLRNAVAIDRRRLSPNDARLGNALSSLGSALEKRGAFKDAIDVLNEAIRIQSLPGAEKADLVESLTYLSNAHHLTGHDSVAEPLNRRVLALDREIYGDRHPSVAEDLMNLGEIQKQLGQYAEAEQNERRGIEIVDAWYGKEHYEVALDTEALAETLIFEKKYDEAQSLFEHARTTQEHVVGKDHPFVALALNWLGFLALKRGNLDEAEADFRRMDRIYRAAFGDKDRHVAFGLLRFGELYVARRDYPHAEQVFRQAIQIYSETLAPDNVLTGTARIELGDALLREKRYPEAESELLAGYRIVTPGRQPSLDAVVTARRDLVALYAELKTPGKAAFLQP